MLNKVYTRFTVTCLNDYQNFYWALWRNKLLLRNKRYGESLPQFIANMILVGTQDTLGLLKKRFLLGLVVGLLMLPVPILAQTPALGSPPIAARITLAPQTPDVVTMTGAAGAVFPRAQVIIRNLHSGETVIVRADTEGAFTADLRGTDLTPYQVHAAENLPNNTLPATGELPGRGVIIQNYAPPQFGGTRAPFVVGGRLAYGGASWSGEGIIEKLRYAPGETLSLQLDVRMFVPAADPTLSLTMRGHLALLPIYRADGAPLANAGDGWSTFLTKTGLPIETLPAPIDLGASSPVVTQRTDDILTFTLDFDVMLPAELPAGLYIPILTGQAQIADSEFFDWYANRVFSTEGIGREATSSTRLPLVLTVGDAAPPGMVWSLLQDAGNDGSGGTLSTAAQLLSGVALSNRVQFSPPTLILPPGTYPIEPYIPVQRANQTGAIAPPLLPFALPGGEYAVTLTRPDGGIDRTTTLPFSQMVVPSAADLARYGGHTPQGMVRLTTLDPLLTDYQFNLYGTYDINVNGFISDITGMRYTGSGAYRVLVAEPLQMVPAVLPGTPFVEGDIFAPGVRLLPGVPADVTVTVRFFPLGRPDVITQTFTGMASRYGDFYSAEAFQFDGAGEYTVEYEARYTDGLGRLWAASLRSAGVVASADSGLIVHGNRGIADYVRDPQAWFDSTFYPEDAPNLPDIVNFPYFSGDVAYIPDSATAGMQPVLSLQDLYGQYTSALLSNAPELAADGVILDWLITTDALPIYAAPDALAYISAMRPDVAVRQFVTDAAGWQLPVRWTNDDPLNQQLGAGAAGNRVGDYVFLFGGVVTPDDAATYAALAVIVPEGDSARVYPPFSAPLFTVRDTPITMFFHPTGTRPGQILTSGDVFTIIGQVAPTLAADVRVKVTAPSGIVREFSGRANQTGYFYVPEGDFAADEPGVWAVEITMTYSGTTSAELLEPPYPQGITRYNVYVTNDSESLTANLADDAEVNAGQPLGFVLQVPPDWSDVQGHYTVATASYVLDSGTLPAPSRRMDYTYSPASLARLFPNLETSGETGAAASDVVVLTFAMTGIDGGGIVRTRTKMFTVFNDRLLAVP